jgi:L-fuculose-phosphate aldolase
MAAKYLEARKAIIEFSNKMVKDRLTRGTLGNISILVGKGLVAITPSGVDYDKMQPEDVPIIDFQGKIVDGHLKASSEAPMHIAIYQRRADTKAIVHTHSAYATAFSVLGKPIPAVHYIVGKLGGNVIPVTARYELYGSEALAQSAVDALGDTYKGVLLRNHGAICIGPTVAKAYSAALNVESMAEVAYLSMTMGIPNVLSDQQMAQAIEKFKGYGQHQSATKQH